MPIRNLWLYSTITLFAISMLYPAPKRDRQQSCEKTIKRNERVRENRQNVHKKLQCNVWFQYLSQLSYEQKVEQTVDLFGNRYVASLPLYKDLLRYGYDLFSYLSLSEVAAHKIKHWNELNISMGARQEELAKIYEQEMNAIYVDMHNQLCMQLPQRGYQIQPKISSKYVSLYDQNEVFLNHNCVSLIQAYNELIDGCCGLNRVQRYVPIFGSSIRRVLKVTEVLLAELNNYKLQFIDHIFSYELHDDHKDLAALFIDVCNHILTRYKTLENYIATLAHFGGIISISWCDLALLRQQNDASVSMIQCMATPCERIASEYKASKLALEINQELLAALAQCSPFRENDQDIAPLAQLKILYDSVTQHMIACIEEYGKRVICQFFFSDQAGHLMGLEACKNEAIEHYMSQYTDIVSLRGSASNTPFQRWKRYIVFLEQHVPVV